MSALKRENKQAEKEASEAVESEEMQAAKAASESAASRTLKAIEKKAKEKKILHKIRNSHGKVRCGGYPKPILPSCRIWTAAAVLIVAFGYYYLAFVRK